MGRRGPKPTWAEDANREPVVGLILRSDGRYVAHENRNKTFGKDRDEAIRRFEVWRSKQRGETVAVVESGPPTEAVRQDWEHWAEHHSEPEAREYYRQSVANLCRSSLRHGQVYLPPCLEARQGSSRNEATA